MGYYTQYTLDVVDLDDETVKASILEFITTNDICNSYHQVPDSKYNLTFGESTDDIKWYAHHDDMIMLSKAFPNVVFSLYGVGEENGDEWMSYYKLGKSAVYSRDDWSPPPFNEDDLD